MAKKMVNIRLDEDLWKQAKLDAVRQELTLQDWVALAIIRLLDDGRLAVAETVPASVPTFGQFEAMDQVAK